MPLHNYDNQRILGISHPTTYDEIEGRTGTPFSDTKNSSYWPQ